MNFSAIFIEISVLLASFTVLVFGMLLISPLTFISDYPPEIQAEYYRSQHRETTKEKLTRLMLVKKGLPWSCFCSCLRGCCIWQALKPSGRVWG